MPKRYIIAIIVFLLIFGFSLACTAEPETKTSEGVSEPTYVEETTELEETEITQDNSYLQESLDLKPASFSEDIFTFDYPSNWKVIDDNAVEQLFKTSLEGDSRDSFDYIGGVYVGESWAEDIGEAVFTIFIVSDTSFSNTITEEQYNNIKDSYESQFGDRLISIDKIKFKDFDAVELKTIGKSEQTQSWAINITVDGMAFMLDLRSIKELYAGYEPIFTNIIDSLEIMY